MPAYPRIPKNTSRQTRKKENSSGTGQRSNPQAYESNTILALQRSIGNQAVQRLLHTDSTDRTDETIVPADRQPKVTHAGEPLVQRREDMDLVAQQMMSDVSRQADEMVEQYRGNPEGLAARIISAQSTDTDILSNWDRSQTAFRVLDRFPDQAGLARALARQLTNERVREFMARPQGVNMLRPMAMAVRRGGYSTDAERIMSIVVNPAHGHLFGEAALQNQAVQDALRTRGASVQSITRGVSTPVFDEYWIVMDAMPANLTPEAYLTEMSNDLNAAVNSEDFNDVNVFVRTPQDRRRGAPALGDIHDINILGPDNGSVMLVERTQNHFIFQTITTSQTGEHPENGSREFGFERLNNGAVRWYTRGVSSAGSDMAAIVGASIQERGWTAMLVGIGNTLRSRGGRLRAGSFGHWIRRM